MSTRNPVTGKRRKVKPGDRVIYNLPPGPPAAAIEMFGGDVQAAITAALSLMVLMPQGPVSQPSAISQPEPSSPSDPLQGVYTQNLFGD